MKFREIPKEIKMPGKVIDTVAAAEYLGKSVETLKRWRSRGEGPPCWKDKYRVWYDTNDIEFWLKSKGNPVPSDRQYIVGQLAPENADDGEMPPEEIYPSDPAIRAKNIAEAQARMAASTISDERYEIEREEQEWCLAVGKAEREGKPEPPMPPRMQARYDARQTAERAKQAPVETDDVPEFIRRQAEAQKRAASR